MEAIEGDGVEPTYWSLMVNALDFAPLPQKNKKNKKILSDSVPPSQPPPFSSGLLTCTTIEQDFHFPQIKSRRLAWVRLCQYLSLSVHQFHLVSV